MMTLRMYAAVIVFSLSSAESYAWWGFVHYRIAKEIVLLQSEMEFSAVGVSVGP